MTNEQRTALVHPCFRAVQTQDPRYRHPIRLESGAVLRRILTVNK